MTGRLGILVLVILIMLGCETDPFGGLIKKGMTRKEVVDSLGKPSSTRNLKSGELLQYDELPNAKRTNDKKIPYIVVIREDEVNDFGEATDFDAA